MARPLRIPRGSRRAAQADWTNRELEQLRRVFHILGVDVSFVSTLRGGGNLIHVTGTPVTFRFDTRGRFRSIMVDQS